MMKVNLHSGENTRDAYSNLDVRETNNPSSRKVENYSLMEYPANEIEELIAHAGTLESMERNEVIESLKSWHERISVGGSLKISFVESKKIANAFCYNNIDLVTYESHLISSKSMHSMFEIRSTLISLGFKINTCDFSINDYIGTIHAEK